MLNSKIKINYPFHLHEFTFALKQQLEDLGKVFNKIGTLFTIHVV